MVVAAIFAALPRNRAICNASRVKMRDSLPSKIASERPFSQRLKRTDLIPTAEVPAISELAVKIASKSRCAILVHPVFPTGSKIEP